ncbi:hypothetical protein AB0I66_34625 [Streptomyces sp. NPDC050439]|uniref:hypothetical protein n=1 Tax=unclassified Streptomyces TaxID=2593676 RepID=UPI0034304E04
MDVLLPALVDRLLGHGPDPGEIPEVPADDVTGWLVPLATRLLGLLEQRTPKAPNAFLAHGFACLPLTSHDGGSLSLRLAYEPAWTPWPITSSAVVLTVTGSLGLEVYQRPDDVQACRPQYARTFGPEQVFAAHPGTLCALRSSPGAMHVLAAAQPEAGPIGPVPFDGAAVLAHRARWVLQRAVGAGCGGGR